MMEDAVTFLKNTTPFLVTVVVMSFLGWILGALTPGFFFGLAGGAGYAFTQLVREASKPE